MRYLGIRICKTYEEMLKKNVMPIINQIQEKCRCWNSYPLSWMGRIAAVKMVVLPELIFVFLNVILEVSSLVLNRLQDMINRFVWGNKRARIKSRILEQGLEDGGLAIPSITKYYYAAILTASLDWCWFSSDNANLLLEQKECKIRLSEWLVSDTRFEVPLK